MKALFGFFTRKWVIQLFGVLALCALIWYAGPLIAIAGTVPLGPEWVRGAAITVLFVGWVIWRLVAELRAARKDRQFMDELAKPAAGKSAESLATEENLGLVAESFEKALTVLRESRAVRKGDKHYLYELPWYVIIGPPGSGKTTALLNSGLSFPLAEKLGNQPIRGISGTRNCEWLFTDEAILIDTAGRYTTQESYQAVDAAEWTGFLDLLKQHRPRRPINGVLVTVSLSDLLQQTEEERTLHAKAVRQRVQELYTRLGVRFPIYMLATKCDLVAGFTDFFGDLTQEERAQVWGETFAAEEPAQRVDVLAQFGAAYDELMQRLNQRTLKRIQDERDVQRRSLVLDYPQQMMLLKPVLMHFLEQVFGTNRYETKPLLRGIYLTSGTQEGTPIDRLMGILAATYRFGRQAAPIYSGRGKSYFLTRLLREVIFPEAGLAGTDARVERRQRLLQVGTYAGVLLVTLACLGLWTVSYQRNVSAIGEAQQSIDAYRAARIDPANWQSTLRTLLPKLNALQAIGQLYADSGWSMHFGLYQGTKLAQAAEHAYEHWLKDYFLPVNMRRTADRMTGPEASNPDILYELLRVYLMLGEPERMDPKIAGAWIRSDFEHQFAAEPEVLNKLSLHLDNLLKLKLDPVPIDENFVASIRARLVQVPQPIQLYARFKHEALLDPSHDFNLGQTLGPLGDRVFTAGDGRAINTLTVPGLYTASGYADLFLKKSLAFVKDSVTENWVVGRQSNMGPADIERLHKDFERLYLMDYQKAWMDLLGNLRLRRPADINQDIEWLDVLSRPDTPLRPLLESIEKNTSLTRISLLPAPLAGTTPATPAAPDPRTQQLLAAAHQAAGLQGKADDPAWNVQQSFESLNELVRSTADRPAALEGTLKTLGSVHDYMLQVGGAAATGGQALKSASGRLAGGDPGVLMQAKSEFGRLPEPLKGWLLFLANFGESQSLAKTLAGAKGELKAMLQTGVGTPCRNAFAGRYPFSAGSPREVTLMDFAKFLAPNGVLDQFFQNNLKDFVDVNRPVWAESKTGPQSLGLSPGTLRQFQNAAKIRAAFFATGGTAPSVSFQLRPLSLDDNVGTFRLILEGQEVVYRHGPEQVSQLQWPGPNAGSGARIVFETLDGRQVSRSYDGAWALFRLLDEAVLQRTDLPEKFFVTFRAENFSARYDLRAGSVSNPFGLPELHAFSCPDTL